MITFGCSQMTVLYSALPLLWFVPFYSGCVKPFLHGKPKWRIPILFPFVHRLSIFNIMLLVYLNMFCVLTGGWGLLQFERFRTDEKDFTKV